MIIIIGTIWILKLNLAISPTFPISKTSLGTNGVINILNLLKDMIVIINVRIVSMMFVLKLSLTMLFIMINSMSKIRNGNNIYR